MFRRLANRTAAAAAAPFEIPASISSSLVKAQCVEDGLFVTDLFDLVDQRKIEDVRHEARDALDLTRTRLSSSTRALLREHGTCRGRHRTEKLACRLAF